MTAKETTEKKETKRWEVGLALSGGGYRASLFHLGALWRLNELGWLRKLDCITSVSGGSIVAGYLGSRWSELEFEPDREDGVARNFEEVFIKPMREMFSTTIDVPTITRGLLNPIGSVQGRVAGERLADSAVGILGEVAQRIGGNVGSNVVRNVARPMGRMFGFGVDAAAVAWDALNRFPTPAELLIKTYDRLLFHGKTLQDFPDPVKGRNPEFLLYATNMQSGASVRMSKKKLADYKVGEIPAPMIPLARAVAASSGFPPFYCPVEIKVPIQQWKKRSYSTLYDRAKLRERMDLGDGAVYDNLGMTTLEQRHCGTILVSDAGDTLDAIDAVSFEWLGQILRTLLVSMDQVNKLRKSRLITDYKEGRRKGAYWGIGGRIASLKNSATSQSPGSRDKAPALLKDSDQTRAMGEMRTRLNRFTDEEQENLINWGYALADVSMRQYVITEDPPGSLPFPGRLE